MKHIEAFLNSMHGVLSSQVFRADEGYPEQVYILVDKSGSRAPSARDVQTALLTKYNLHIELERIFVIRTQGSGTLRDGHAIDRFQLIGVTSGILSEKTLAKVCLSWDNKLALGIRRGYASPNGKLRLVAEATVLAIHEAVGFSLGLRVLDVTQIDIAGQQCVATMVFLSGRNKAANLPGIAIVDGNLEMTVAGSVLDAINRNIDLFALIQEVKDSRGIDSMISSSPFAPSV